MQQVYNIEGMTCNGCRTDVENKLNAIAGISAFVDLEKAEAILNTQTHFSEEELQKVLPIKYTISKKVNSEKAVEKVGRKHQLHQLFPLFLIFGYITIASILLNYKDGGGNSFMLDFMGLFYIVFSFFKMLDVKGFSESFKMYDPLAKKLPVYGVIYPFLELSLGLLFLLRIQITLALISTIIVLGITTFGVTKILLDKKDIQCACLGTVLKLPMTKATFIENSIMLIMAVIMLCQQ